MKNKTMKKVSEKSLWVL